MITFAYVTGWRITSEVLPLQWRHIDFKAGEIRLDPSTTKNREDRVFKMTIQLRQLLEGQRDERDRVKKESDRIRPWLSPSVFQRYNIVSDRDLREAAVKLNVAAGR